MRGLGLIAALALGIGAPAQAQDCASLVKSVCVKSASEGPAIRRVLKVEVQPPLFAKGDRFPVEERSLLMNPARYRLPKVDGPWRYYALKGVVYKVDNATATITEVIRDDRTWNLR